LYFIKKKNLGRKLHSYVFISMKKKNLIKSALRHSIKSTVEFGTKIKRAYDANLKTIVTIIVYSKKDLEYQG